MRKIDNRKCTALTIAAILLAGGVVWSQKKKADQKRNSNQKTEESL